MYLAPLNYDRFFKKVFSDLQIAKQFLEDFLDTNISNISILENRHKLTDNAQSIEFDFRCQIDNKFVIIDMQQWYKTDVIKRFYMYHTVNTAIQLERLPVKSFISQEYSANDELKLTVKNTRDYRFLEPVLTLIWMVDDTLHFKAEDYVAFSMAPEVALEFLEKDEFWLTSEMQQMQRKIVLETIQNQYKNLDFLRQNRMIYIFQPNIIKNKKIKKYLRWFEFAEKTKNKENTEVEFKEYENDVIFLEMMRRLRTDNLNQEDFEYINNYEEVMARVERLKEGLREEGKYEGKMEGKIEGKMEGKIEIAKKMIKRGKSLDEIAEITDLTIAEVENLSKNIDN